MLKHKCLMFLLIFCFYHSASLASPQAALHIEDVYLKTPNLSEENILEVKVGVLPVRRSGIRLEADQMDGKILIHNYGYGGAGLPLCWEGVQEVFSILNQEKTNTPRWHLATQFDNRLLPKPALLGKIGNFSE